MEETLCKLIDDGLSQRQIGKILGLSQTAVRHWLVKLSLKTKHQQTNRKSKAGVCAKCGDDNSTNFYRYKNGRISSWCKRCHNDYSVARFRRYKSEAVAYKGGKCEICGYDKCLGSLDFHHKDSSEKDPKWELMRNWKFDKVKDELDKCTLLCKNCHGEVHWNDAGVA